MKIAMEIGLFKIIAETITMVTLNKEVAPKKVVVSIFNIFEEFQ